MQALARLFDQVREVVAAKVGLTYEAASAFATHDDLLNAAEDLERVLEEADPAWAGALLPKFADVTTAAIRESLEATEARQAEQKAQLVRAQAEGMMRPVLVAFRRAVRATFGSSSREYRGLLDRRGRGAQEDDPTPAPAAS
jgi:hypothetical protein